MLNWLMLRSKPAELLRYINLKLVALGQPSSHSTADPYFLEIAGPLLRNFHQKDQLLGGRLCPADSRIQQFLDACLADVCPGGAARLPSDTFVLDRPGLARVMSLPPSADEFVSPYLHSYRIVQGVLHNPKSDRRTTDGLFHIVEGGLPIPADKMAVPKPAFASLLAAALRPPAESAALPFTADQDEQARLFVSLLLRPMVCPSTGTDPAKTMEIRFFAPGNLVSNLDFVEMIFGNGGDPYLPENDAGLDVLQWTGHTGCVILAPHIVGLPKKDLGLPHFDQATERQKRDGMCWRGEDESYNNGRAFKLVCRDRRGVIVTLIADNYYGYCKKEVKSQISFAANLFGLCEEEHAGGAIAYPAYVPGQDFQGERSPSIKKIRFEDAMRLLDDRVERRPEGYAVDRKYPNIFYVPENAEFHVGRGSVKWPCENASGGSHELTLLPDRVYILPSGYKVRMEKQQGGTAWRLVGSVAHGTLCHKPCTVSGGGKSEISKSISNVLMRGPVFVRDYYHDMDQVAEILARDFSSAYKQSDARAGRPILSEERSLGSVIKLLTASPDYTPAYNEWLRDLPQTIRQLVFTVKRYYRPEWGDNWRSHFTVDRINGFLGHELKYDDQKLLGNYLRVGFDPQGSWRIYKLRPDFHPADKVQVEDDITVSVVVPRPSLRSFDTKYPNRSAKLVENCEAFLFQRPDDAIHRGFDAQAEADIAAPGNFLSNFEPLTAAQAQTMVDHVVEFDQYTEPMKMLLRDFVRDPKPAYAVSSANRAPGGRASLEESALPATAAGPGRPAGAVPGRSVRTPGSRNTVGPAGPVPCECRAGWPPRQPGGCEDRAAAARCLQPHSLSGTAGAVHGFHLQCYRQVSINDGIRKRRRADEGSLQCGFAGGRFEQRAGGGGADGDSRFYYSGRLHRSALPRGSRHQHAGAGSLVPCARAGARSAVPHRKRSAGKNGGFRVAGAHSARQPPGLSDYGAFRGAIPGPDFRSARYGLSGRDPAT